MLLDACTIMGTEALVEVHTPSELEYALSVKATNFLVNNWDRMSGILYPEQVNLSFVLAIFFVKFSCVKFQFLSLMFVFTELIVQKHITNTLLFSIFHCLTRPKGS